MLMNDADHLPIHHRITITDVLTELDRMRSGVWTSWDYVDHRLMEVAYHAVKNMQAVMDLPGGTRFRRWKNEDGWSCEIGPIESPTTGNGRHLYEAAAALQKKLR
jgi:hypothetical protein